MDERRGRTLLGGLLVAAAAVVGIWYLVHGAGPQTGPQPIAWDRQACDQCQMLISEPAFAAQLITAGGRQHAFDDPGCLFVFVEEQRISPRESWFRHHREDRWLPGSGVAFTQVSSSPMGYGLAAVDAGTAGALSAEEARARVLQSRRAESQLPGGGSPTSTPARTGPLHPGPAP